MAVPLFKFAAIATALGLQHTSSDEQEMILREYTSENWMQKGFVRTVGLAELAFLYLAPAQVYDSASPSSVLVSIFGTGLVICGSYLRRWCFSTIRRQIGQMPRPVTSGPYAYVRHPSHTGFIMTCVGLSMWQAAPGSCIRKSGVLTSVVGKVLVGCAAFINVAMAAALITKVPSQDRDLEDSIASQQWEAWTEIVPYKLIPFVY